MFITLNKSIIRTKCLLKREKIINQAFLRTKGRRHISTTQQQGTQVQVLGGIGRKRAKELRIEIPLERIAPTEALPSSPSTKTPEENILTCTFWFLA